MHSHASVGGGEIPTILGVVLAVVGIGLTIHPPKRGHFTRWIAFGCYLAAAELLGLLIPAIPLVARVLGGLAAIGAFILIERRKGVAPSTEQEDAPAAHTARDRAKIKIERSPHKGFKKLTEASDESEISISESPTDRDA